MKLINKEKVDEGNKQLDYLLIDSKCENLQEQLRKLKKEVYILEDGSLSFFSQAEHDSLLLQQQEKKDQINRFCTILESVYEEV